MEGNEKDVQTRDQEAGQNSQQPNADVTLENFLSDPKRKSAYDASVNAAVDRALADYKAAQEEEKRVAALSDQEKAEEREKALAAREAKLQAAEYKSEAVTRLAAAGLSPELAECLNYGSKEAYEQSYTAATAAFEKAVQAGVNDRLRGKTPPVVQQEGGAGTAAKAKKGGFADIINENRARR